MKTCAEIPKQKKKNRKITNKFLTFSAIYTIVDVPHLLGAERILPAVDTVSAHDGAVAVQSENEQEIFW